MIDDVYEWAEIWGNVKNSAAFFIYFFFPQTELEGRYTILLPEPKLVTIYMFFSCFHDHILWILCFASLQLLSSGACGAICWPPWGSYSRKSSATRRCEYWCWVSMLLEKLVSLNLSGKLIILLLTCVEVMFICSIFLWQFWEVYHHVNSLHMACCHMAS